MTRRQADAWVLMPTAQASHAQETVDKWRDMGYRVAVYVDHSLRLKVDSYMIGSVYPGVWAATNRLAAMVALSHRDQRIDDYVCLFAGDDMHPDPNLPAHEIAGQYLEKFPDGCGVMQPCGDPGGRESWDGYSQRCPQDALSLSKNGGECFIGKWVPAAARICGSAWFGKGWIERSYLGKGPVNQDYWHFYGDEELAAVASKLGVMWWRPDLTQMHFHWSRGVAHGGLPKQPYHDANQTHWTQDQALYELRKSQGWPGHELSPV